MDKFQNKYRIPSTRLQNWDYRQNGAYFITICTKNRKHYFGEIVNRKIELSHIGIIADILWHQIPHHAKNVTLEAFVVMPNHIHGILVLNDNGDGNITDGNNDITDGDIVDGDIIVQTLHATSLPQSTPPPFPEKNEQMSKISPKKNAISTIIRSYKSAVTKHAHRLGFEFAWQPLFYDHIIRNHRSFENISNYIINNPSKWREDTFFKPETE